MQRCTAAQKTEETTVTIVTSSSMSSIRQSESRAAGESLSSHTGKDSCSSHAVQTLHNSDIINDALHDSSKLFSNGDDSSADVNSISGTFGFLCSDQVVDNSGTSDIKRPLSLSELCEGIVRHHKSPSCKSHCSSKIRETNNSRTVSATDCNHGVLERECCHHLVECSINHIECSYDQLESNKNNSSEYLQNYCERNVPPTEMNNATRSSDIYLNANVVRTVDTVQVSNDLTDATTCCERPLVELGLSLVVSGVRDIVTVDDSDSSTNVAVIYTARNVEDNLSDDDDVTTLMLAAADIIAQRTVVHSCSGDQGEDCVAHTTETIPTGLLAPSVLAQSNANVLPASRPHQTMSEPVDHELIKAADMSDKLQSDIVSFRSLNEPCRQVGRTGNGDGIENSADCIKHGESVESLAGKSLQLSVKEELVLEEASQGLKPDGNHCQNVAEVFQLHKTDQQTGCGNKFESKSLLVGHNTDKGIEIRSTTVNMSTVCNPDEAKDFEEQLKDIYNDSNDCKSRDERQDWLVAVLQKLHCSDSNVTDASVLVNRKKELCNEWIRPLTNDFNRVLSFCELAFEIASTIKRVQFFGDFESVSERTFLFYCDVLNDLWRRASYCYAWFACLVDTFIDTDYKDHDGIERLGSLYGVVEENICSAVASSKIQLDFFLRLAEICRVNNSSEKDLCNKLKSLCLQSIEPDNVNRTQNWFQIARSTSSSCNSSSKFHGCTADDDKAHVLCSKLCKCEKMCNSQSWCLYDHSFCATSELRRILDRYNCVDSDKKKDEKLKLYKFCRRWLASCCIDLENLYDVHRTLLKNRSERPYEFQFEKILGDVRNSLENVDLNMGDIVDYILKLVKRGKSLDDKDFILELEEWLRYFRFGAGEEIKHFCPPDLTIYLYMTRHEFYSGIFSHKEDIDVVFSIKTESFTCGAVTSKKTAAEGTQCLKPVSSAVKAAEMKIKQRWREEISSVKENKLSNRDGLVQFIRSELKSVPLNSRDQVRYFTETFENDLKVLTRFNLLSMLSSCDFTYQQVLLLLLANRQRELHRMANNLLWISVALDNMLHERGAEKIDIEKTIVLLCRIEEQRRDMCEVRAEITLLQSRVVKQQVTQQNKKSLRKELNVKYDNISSSLVSIKSTSCAIADGFFCFIVNRPAQGGAQSNDDLRATDDKEKPEIIHREDCLSLFSYECVCSMDLTVQDLRKLIKEVESPVMFERCAGSDYMGNVTEIDAKLFRDLFASNLGQRSKISEAADVMSSRNLDRNGEFLTCGLQPGDYFRHMLCRPDCLYDVDVNVIELYDICKSNTCENIQKLYNRWLSKSTADLHRIRLVHGAVSDKFAQNSELTSYSDIVENLLTIKNKAESSLCAVFSEAVKSRGSVHEAECTSVEQDWRVRFITVCTEYEALNAWLKKIVVVCVSVNRWLCKLGHRCERNMKVNVKDISSRTSRKKRKPLDVESGIVKSIEVKATVESASGEKTVSNKTSSCHPKDESSGDMNETLGDYETKLLGDKDVGCEAGSESTKLSTSIKLFSLLKDLVGLSDVNAKQAKVVFCNQWLAPLLSKLSEASRMCEEMRDLVSLVPGIPSYQETVDNCSVLVDEVKLSVERLVDKVLSITVDDEDTPAERQLYEDYRNIKQHKLKDLIKTVREKLDWLKQSLCDHPLWNSMNLSKRPPSTLSAYIEYCHTAEGEQVRVIFVHNESKKSCPSGANRVSDIHNSAQPTGSNSKAKSTNLVQVQAIKSKPTSISLRVSEAVVHSELDKQQSNELYHFDDYSTQGVKGKKGPVFQPQAACLTKRKHRSVAAEEPDPSVAEGHSQRKAQSITKVTKNIKVGNNVKSKESLETASQEKQVIVDSSSEDELFLPRAKNRLDYDRRSRMKAIWARNRSANQKRERN